MYIEIEKIPVEKNKNKYQLAFMDKNLLKVVDMLLLPVVAKRFSLIRRLSNKTPRQ